MELATARAARWAFPLLLAFACANAARCEQLTAKWTGPGEPPGSPHCVPVPGDYLPNNGPELAVYCEDGAWHFFDRSEPNTYLGGVFVGFQGAEQSPAPADYDLDGFMDPAIYRDGSFLIYDATSGALQATVAVTTSAGCQPVPAVSKVDPGFIGNAGALLAIFCPAPDHIAPTHYEWRIYSQTGTELSSFQALDENGAALMPGAGEELVALAADWNGNVGLQPTVFRNGAWFVYSADDEALETSFWTGPPNSEPAPLDHDGDGRDEPTTYCDNGGVECTPTDPSGIWHAFDYEASTNQVIYAFGVWAGNVSGVEERPISRRIQN